MSAVQPEVLSNDCPMCGGAGEVSISVDGTHDSTDYYGCPICISRERDEDIKRLRALNAELLEVLKHIRRCIPYGGFVQIHDNSMTLAQIDAAIAKAEGGAA